MIHIEKIPFTSVQYEDVLRKIKSWNVSKPSQQSDIPTKILIKNCEYFACYFYESINYCLDKAPLSLLDLKLANVASVYKKKSKSSKDNYISVNILSNISKIYERIITLTKSYLANNVDFVKVIMCNTV